MKKFIIQFIELFHSIFFSRARIKSNLMKTEKRIWKEENISPSIEKRMRPIRLLECLLQQIHHQIGFSQFFAKFRRKIAIFMSKLRKFDWIEKWNYSFLQKLWRLFCWNFEIWAVQRNDNLVDLEKCCEMSICLLLLLFGCKNRRWYSRERALQSFLY